MNNIHTLGEINNNPHNYKLCDICGNINWHDNLKCHVCENELHYKVSAGVIIKYIESQITKYVNEKYTYKQIYMIQKQI